MEIEDDLDRSRLTVFFRLLLAIPHYIWIFLWSIAAAVVAIINWFATLITGQSPRGLHNFLSYVRYVTHFYSYLLLAANPYPGFTGEPNSYPIHVEIDAPARQRRWVTAFRIFLALPAFVLASTLVEGSGEEEVAGAPSGGSVQPDDIGFFFRDGRGGVHGGIPRLVRHPRARPDAQRFQRPRRVWDSLQRPGDRVPVHGHRSLPQQRRPSTPQPPPPHPIALEVADDGSRSASRSSSGCCSRFRISSGSACGHRPLVRLDRELGHHALRRPLTGGAAQIRERVRPLRRPRLRLPLPDREPVSRLHRRPRLVRSTSRSNRGRVRAAG